MQHGDQNGIPGSWKGRGTGSCRSNGTRVAPMQHNPGGFTVRRRHGRGGVAHPICFARHPAAAPRPTPMHQPRSPAARRTPPSGLFRLHFAQHCREMAIGFRLAAATMKVCVTPARSYPSSPTWRVERTDATEPEAKPAMKAGLCALNEGVRPVGVDAGARHRTPHSRLR